MSNEKQEHKIKTYLNKRKWLISALKMKVNERASLLSAANNTQIKA